MDDDGEVDSDSETVGSLSWWMMKSLWQENSLSEKKLRLSLPDTVLLQDGHLLHWFFTSSKSGSVLKRATKRLDWNGLVNFLLRSAVGTVGKGKRTKERCASSAEIIATARRLRDGQTYPVMLTCLDLKILREKHNVHLLDEIVAIQPFVAKDPFTGCGVFETAFERKRTDQVTLATYELLRWPEDDVKWFGDVELSGANSSARGGVGFAQQRRRNRSAKRVHGVLHRMLATTTKHIVEHVQRVTGEIILKVVAQFIFRRGTGEPTLLWLDSVHTVRSTQQVEGHTLVEVADPNSAFTRLTRELGEGSCLWTTFFPPKMGDLTSGKGSSGMMGAGLIAGSKQSDFLHNGAGDASPATCGQTNEKNGAFQGSNGAENCFHCATRDEVTDGVFPVPGGTGGNVSNAIAEEKDAGISTCKVDSVDGYRPTSGVQWDHFTLPTESWVSRSAGRRGNYFSATRGEEACAGRSLKGQWPRKRSTGTTMRRDGLRHRSDLRSACENQRPWTSPASQAMGNVVSGARGGPSGGGAVCSRFTRESNGCYGDYCHCRGVWSSHHGSSSSGIHIAANGRCFEAADRKGSENSMASKLVPFRSILKSRAEEKALSSWVPSPLLPTSKVKVTAGNGGWKVGPEHLPTLTDFGKTDGRHRKRRGEPNLASVIAERMRLLAASLSDRGGEQYFGLCSFNRATVGTPEAAQRAIEELLYEEMLSHLHPTTVNRMVTVCDACAMVYGYMDTFRQQTKCVKAASSKTNRAARAAISRGQRDQSLLYTATTEDEGDASPLLRRYSDLNLAPMTAPSATNPRASVSDGSDTSGSGSKGRSSNVRGESQPQSG